MSETLGGTLGLGPVIYQGGRDELSRKCRARDDAIDALRAEITTLRAQLEEARAKAIEECAQIADAELADPKNSGRSIAKLLRALIAGSTK